MQNQISKANLALANAGEKTKKMISGVKKNVGAPRRFVADKLSKLDAIAMNSENGRLKRFAAAKTRNVLSKRRSFDISSLCEWPMFVYSKKKSKI